MLEVLKSIHLLSLFAAGGAAFGNGVLMTKFLVAKEGPTPTVGSAMKALGMMGTGSIILLWVTGVIMVMIFGYDTSSWEFILKMVAAAIVLVGSITIIVRARRAEAAGSVPNMQQTKSIARVMMYAAILAVVLAVLAFN